MIDFKPIATTDKELLPRLYFLRTNKTVTFPLLIYAVGIS